MTRPPPDLPPPPPDDFVLFRRLVRKAPPFFLAVLIVLGIGAILSRLAFLTYTPRIETDAFISIRGAMEAGGDDQGPDEDEGAEGEESPEPETPQPDAAAKPAEEAPLEPSRWLEPLPAPSPVGPAPSAPPSARPESSAIKPAVSGGGGGHGAKGSGPGSGSPWGRRRGTGRGEGVRERGGTQASESAVERGLSWLRRHQAENGAWRADDFGRQCPVTDPCRGEAMKGVDYDTGVTALALMAFLGGGYTHQEGRFRKTVDTGISFLRALQTPEGRFGSESMYAQSLCCIVFAESLGLTADESLRGPLQRGVAFLLRSQQARGGWTYDPRPRRERNDTSITAFAVMALKAARAAGVEVPEGAFEGARRHLRRATQPNGDVWYADAPPGWDRRGAGMIAAALFTSFLLGRSLDHPLAQKQLGRLSAFAPAWGDERDLDQSYVAWYYMNLVHFLAGGPSWARWNPVLRDLLVEKQRRGGCADGSWDPADLWGSTSGRIYATAIHVLNLEIYYKYTPSFLIPSETSWDDDGTAAGEDLSAGARSGEAAEPEDPGAAAEPRAGETPQERLERLRKLLETLR